MAKIPASTPGPRIATRRSAQISALIDLDATITKSAIGRTKATLGVVSRAARKATGTAIRSERRVPSVAMVDLYTKARQQWSIRDHSRGDLQPEQAPRCTGPPPPPPT